jgi:hypothetical protein
MITHGTNLALHIPSLIKDRRSIRENGMYTAGGEDRAWRRLKEESSSGIWRTWINHPDPGYLGHH